MTDSAWEHTLRSRFAALDAAHWDAIAAARDALRAPGPHASWAGGEQREDGSFSMAYVVEGPALEAARRAMGEAELVIPFDWSAWLRESGLDRDSSRWATLSPEEGVRLWISLVRADRFSEGTVLSAAENGLIVHVLDAVLRARPSA